MRARGVEPPNHMKDNARSIRLLEAQVRARRDKENEPKEPEWKIERLKHVPSKVAEVRCMGFCLHVQSWLLLMRVCAYSHAT